MTIHVRRMATFWARARGLLGRPAPLPGHAAWITPCAQVHTFFMRYAVDVVFLDAGGAVLEVMTLPPWRVSPRVPSAVSVLELRAGEAARQGLGLRVTPRLIEV
jgi:uncharacterized protein